MNKQEVFDKVAEHLLTQAEPAMAWNSDAGGEMCAYRGEAGLKCAVGCMIDDANYSPTMEGRIVRHLNLPFTADIVSLLEDLQLVHDSAVHDAFTTSVLACTVGGYG